METVITILYTAGLLYLFLFSLGQLHLTWTYLKKSTPLAQKESTAHFEPIVTVQLPVFNEKYVIERLLNAVALLDYPRHKLEIQVLDDSTDETTAIIFQKLEEMKALGIDIRHIQRGPRKDFKAGALQNGLQKARGECIAIFDADFIPQPDFLKKTVAHFVDAKVGAVQTRWGHVNRDYSLLTSLQAFGLDAHFTIEQRGRNMAGSFINFNGTCGVWRKQAIEDAGGWSADTLTEDLDLSYRAQLKGWNFHYLEDVVTPGELPVIMPVIKSQQYRWNKGGAETARKIFSHVLRAPLSAKQKLHAFFHLFNSSVFVAVLVAGICSVPMLFIKNNNPGLSWIFDAGTVFLLGFLSITLFYWVATKKLYKHPVRTFARLFPLFLIISMGLSLHNGVAVLEGWLGRKTPFIRTPKFNIINRKEQWRNNTYLRLRLSPVVVTEALLCLYFIFGLITGIDLNDPVMFLFHGMMAVGFGSVFYFSVRPMAHG